MRIHTHIHANMGAQIYKFYPTMPWKALIKEKNKKDWKEAKL